MEKPDWLHRIAQVIETEIPETQDEGQYLVLRLSSMFFERLSVERRKEIIGHLPEEPSCLHPLVEEKPTSTHEPILPDRSIGYACLLERAVQAFSMKADPKHHSFDPTFSHPMEEYVEPLSRRIVDVFLREIGREVPEASREEWIKELPIELHSKIFTDKAEKRSPNQAA